MKDFSAYHISSRGLKYALAHSAFGQGEVEEADYKKALLNVLTAQDFDSIPLVESYGGPITAIGRRRLHDGDLDDVFILSTEEVSKLPQTAPVIRCIFEVLSNEHHIVFLTDEDEVITDVVTISMLTSPLIQEYLTLLVSKLTSEGWDFNEQHLNSAFVPTYDYPKIIHEELKKLGELVDHPKGVIPSDFDVSKQIVHILSLLQPLKLWEGGQKSEALTSTDYPLKIVTPDYKPGTAGYFAQHPFGSVKEDGNEELAFRLFSEANNWDRLLLISDTKYSLIPFEGKNYAHILEKKQGFSQPIKSEISHMIEETKSLDDIVGILTGNPQPVCVLYNNSDYPGILTVEDVVYSEFTKNKLLLLFLDFENVIRNTILHHLGSIDTSPNRLNYFSSGDYVWKAPLSGLHGRLSSVIAEGTLPITSLDFKRILELRNSLAHNDFSVSPEDEIDPIQTENYLKLLRNDRKKIEHFIESGIERQPNYKQFAQIFMTEFLKLKLHKVHPFFHLNKQEFKQSFVQIKHVDSEFHIYFNAKSVVWKAERVRDILQSRFIPWKCRILHWPSEETGEEIQSGQELEWKNCVIELNDTSLKENLDKESELEIFRKAAKNFARSSFSEKITESELIESENSLEVNIKKNNQTRSLAKEELVNHLKSEIQKALVRCVDTSNEIANEEFRSLIKRITKGARKKYSLTNQEIREITGLSKGALRGSGAILTWCGYTYSSSSIHLETTGERVRFRKIEFERDEEE